MALESATAEIRVGLKNTRFYLLQLCIYGQKRN